MGTLKVYRLFNNVEGKYIFQSNSSQNYIDRVKLIAQENEDNIIIDDVDQADAYILDFCDNLDVE